MPIEIQNNGKWEAISASNVRWDITKRYKEVKSFGEQYTQRIPISPIINGVSFDIDGEFTSSWYVSKQIEIRDTDNNIQTFIKIASISGKSVTAYVI